MAKFVIAADIGGTKIAVARVSHTGTITDRREAPTPSEGGGAVFERLITLLREVPLQDALAIAVDVPGLAYRDGSVWAPNIPGWQKFPLQEKLERAFRLPVLVESDRNAFVMGEAWQGVAKGHPNAIFLAVGTGIGAGILCDGRLVRGHGELAGSVGWMAVRDEFLSSYAAIGCMESLAAGPAIAKLASQRLQQSVNCADLTKLAKNGDETARAVLNEAGRSLGLLLANLVSMFNPSVIVIGGGVVQAGEYFVCPAIEVMRKWAQPIAVKQVRVLISRLGNSAGLLGVAKLAFDAEEKKDKEKDCGK
jgi:glucokinase